MKAKFLALAALVLGLASCQTDMVDGVKVDANGEAPVTIQVGLPEEGTRAAGNDSALGAIGNGLNMDQYDIRFILEVYDAKGTLAKPRMVVSGDETEASFSLRLVPGRDYSFVAWADFVEQGLQADLHYNTNGDNTLGLTKVELKSGAEQKLNDESRDAYTCVETIENFDARSSVSLTLTRPFAKLRVVTTDMNQLYSKLTSATVDYSTEVYTSFNALSQQAGDLSALSTKKVEYNDNTRYADEPNNGKMTLFADYLFGTEDGDIQFILDVDDTTEFNIPEVNFNTSIPVQRNFLTTIQGPILTDPNDITVTIDSRFAKPDHVVDIWDGESKEEITPSENEEGETEYVVNSAAELAWLADFVNGLTASTFATRTSAEVNFVLNTDIDLNNMPWTPIGTPESNFVGTFYGNGHSIKNLNIVVETAKEGKAFMGFFGYAKNTTIKDLTFENVNVNVACLDIDHSQGHIGAVVGSLEGTSTIENLTVKGDIKVYATQDANGASRVGVVVGGNLGNGKVTMKNVHVIANEGSYLIANNNTGALAGQLMGVNKFENCTSNIDVTVNKFFAGGLIGIAGTADNFINCHTTGDIAVVAGREGRHNDEYRVGGIAGGWTDGKNNTCTLIDCTYTGNISGNNVDGSVADPLDYAGYVGRGYTLANCAGSKVIIDSVEYVQKYDNVYGVYTINGLTPVATADELVAALEANEGVFFMNDIKIEPASMSNAYGKTGINVKNGQTIDGNGHTLNIKGAGGTWDSGINTTGGVIKNITVTGSFRGIFINHTSTHSEKVVLENVTIGGNGTVYTISCDQGLYQGIEATNCTFNGWTSFAKTAGEAKFVNCSFGEGSGYKYCRPYSNTEFVNCTFCPGYTVDQSQATVTFTDCTWE